MTFGGKRKTVPHYQMSGMSQRPDGKLGPQSSTETNKSRTNGARRDEKGDAMPLLIFKHPPKASAFPVLAKEGELTRNEEVQGDHEKQVAARFSLGRHRQQVLAKEGLSPFLTAISETRAIKSKAKEAKAKVGAPGEGLTSTRDSVSISAYSQMTNAPTNSSCIGLSSVCGKQQN